MRGIIYAIQRVIYNNTVNNFNSQLELKHISGVGISDGHEIAALLESKFSYKNTFLHTDPFLDICDCASTAGFRNLSFIICSEVLEHTKLTPIEVLPNLRQMLRPGGSVVLTVPTVHMANTIEWYSGAVSVDIERTGETFVVRWKNRRGVEYVDTNPSFHGGPGSTLEMRTISHMELIHAAEQCGFRAETLDFSPYHGYYWPYLTTHQSFSMVDSRVIILERSR